MNEAGVAAGYAGGSGRSGARPAFFSPGTLSSPGLPPWPVVSAGFSAVNAGGDAAGTFYRSDLTTGGFLYSGGVFTEVPTPGFGAAFVNDMNDAGHVVGHLYNPPGGGGPNPGFVYADGTTTLLERRDEGVWNAVAINNAGLIAGTYGTEVDGRRVPRAVLWQAGRIVDDIPLPGPFVGISAIDINETGHVTGTLIRLVASGDRLVEQYEPYVYRDGVVTPLGQASPGVGTVAYGMNDHGDVVGSAGGGAVLYSGGVYTRLGDLVPVPDGWVTAATDINNAGQILIQARPSASHNEERTFLLTPVPEPAVATVLLATPLLLARRRRQPVLTAARPRTPGTRR